jgi:hypothetical protein
MNWKKEKQEKAKGKRQKARKKNHNQPKKPSGRAMAAADEEPVKPVASPEERGGAAVGEDTAGGNTGLEETAIEVEIETKTGALFQLRKDKSSR